VKGAHRLLNMRGSSIAKLDGGASEVFHGIATREHIVVAHALAGGVGDVLNLAWAGKPRDMIAEIGVVFRKTVGFTFGEKYVPTALIVLRAGKALSDVGRMLTAYEYFVNETVGPPKNISICARIDSLFNSQDHGCGNRPGFNG